MKEYTLTEIGRIVGEKELPCGFCDRVIQSGDVDCWGPHDGGIRVAGFSEKQWVFFHCQECGYDWALWKLVKRMEAF